MEKIEYCFTINAKNLRGKKIVCGVVGSGNLEVIIEEHTTSETLFTIQTSVEHYKPVWDRVIEDFVTEYEPAGVLFTINDNGAIPAVVSLRLHQALELFKGYSHQGSNYLELEGRGRIHALCDKDSFVEWFADEKTYSPYLAALNLPGAADDGVVIGCAYLNKKKILIAAQQKDFMGGAVGEIHGAKLTALFKAALHADVTAVILLIDSGGVRLHEANAGEIAISELIRAIFAARHQGITTVGVVCGKNGAFGGMGIISACLDYLIINEIGRIGVSGPEVVQAVAGVEAFDAQDRALVWRVYGGKTRYLQHIAQGYVDFDITSLRQELIVALSCSKSIDLPSLKQKHDVLKKRVQDTQGYAEEGEYLAVIAPHYADLLFNMNKEDFLKAAKTMMSDTL